MYCHIIFTFDLPETTISLLILKISLKNFVDETTRIRLSEDELKKLEEVLLNPPPPNEELKKAAYEYERRGELLAEIIKNDEEMGLYDDTSDWDATLMDGLEDEEPFFTEEEADFLGEIELLMNREIEVLDLPEVIEISSQLKIKKLIF